MNEELEINQEKFLDAYKNALYLSSICIGKLDILLSYCESNYPKDSFISSSLESLLNNMLKSVGDCKYSRIKTNSCASKELLNIVQDIKHEKENLKNNLECLDKNNSYFYIFKNSSLLKQIYYPTYLKITITFQNGRIYDYLNVPKNKIETLITCDKNNISASKYFNSEIKNNYEYREATHDAELIG